MTNAKQPAFHGSDLEQIAKYYSLPQSEIISFGANVNPLGISSQVKKKLAENLDIISRYPDRNYTDLKKAISEYCKIPTEYIVIGNGSTELISLLITQLKASHAVVVGPTYSEYQRELSLTGGHISSYTLEEYNDFRLDVDDFINHLPRETDLVILCNPNNPTSSAVTTMDLERLIGNCQKRGIFVMIDETYVEFAPSVEEITAVPLVPSFDNLMVIRGVSKFFAAPGLRLGYGLTSNSSFLQALKIHQNPWSVSSIAAFAGEEMLKDTSYIHNTRELILSEKKRVCHILDGFRYAKYYKAYGNFILVRITKNDLSSFQVFEHAILQKMMIRDCSSFKELKGEYIRFCIMMPEDNNKLVKCLGEILA